MDSLKNISTEELIKEIANREGVRSMDITKGEFHRTQVSGEGDSKLRYLKGYGPGVILEITKSN